MNIERTIREAQEYLQDLGLSGWLLYDYQNINPIFTETIGIVSNVTRPIWLWIPTVGKATLISGFVDLGRFQHLGIEKIVWASRLEMVKALRTVLAEAKIIAMEYSPQGELPRVSRVDAGTVELIHSLGVEIVSSGDLAQHVSQRWSNPELASHRRTARLLTFIVREAFDYIRLHLSNGITEYDIAEFIREAFRDHKLICQDGPVVAINEHSADPHYEPGLESLQIKKGDWLLIDLWAREEDDNAMYADITWTAYVGGDVPEENQFVFDVVISARDAALREIKHAFKEGRDIQGSEIDKVARDLISGHGYQSYFSHRLGHSLGREVHGNSVNLDSWETNDPRHLFPGLAVTIEPGIYLPGRFGVRSEIDVFIGETGPEVTTEMQQDIVLIL